MFGYVKGAFTGANRDQEGLIEKARGKTIFVDEIGLADRETQAKLLRFVEERQFRPVGGTEYKPLDCRLIAATSRDLEEAVSRGDFLADLVHRLTGITVTLPPLRARREDIPVLIDRMKATLPAGGPQMKLSPDTMAMLFDYDWPGNVRELGKTIERLYVLDPSKVVIDVVDLPTKITSHYPGWKDWEEYRKERTKHFQEQISMLPPKEMLDVAERTKQQAFDQALKLANGNVSQAALILGVNRNRIARKRGKSAKARAATA